MSARNHHKDDARLDTVHNGTFFLDLDCRTFFKHGPFEILEASDCTTVIR